MDYGKYVKLSHNILTLKRKNGQPLNARPVLLTFIPVTKHRVALLVHSEWCAYLCKQ